MAKPEVSLKPCPFCGSKLLELVKSPTFYGWEYFYQCKSCSACGPEGLTEESASVQWNVRP